MPPSAPATSLRVDYLFASVLARTDRWADLNNAGRVWAAKASSWRASRAPSVTNSRLAECVEAT